MSPENQIISHLINIRVGPRIGEYVEARVDIIEELDNFHCAVRVGVTSAIVREAYDSTEQNRDLIIFFRRHRPIVPKFIRDRRW